MPAFVTDQFRILNTNNFVNSIDSGTDNYYVFVGLPNPVRNGFGRNINWDYQDAPDPNLAVLPNPTDNFDYLPHYGDTIVYGKKIISQNVKRCIRRIDWTQGVRYDMYRHDYSVSNRSKVTDRSRLYDANYYVMNSEYQVYICISNGSSGTNPTGNQSQDEPLFVDLEPSKAGTSGDGYIWKYLFTISPTDIIKFDSVEYIPLPNNWETSTLPQIVSVRENGDSTLNNNQIKFVYIDNGGGSYNTGEVKILGDGSGARVYVETNEDNQIVKTTVTAGGSGYTYGIVDLGPLQISDSIQFPAKLIPIIPPSRGHGYDLYKELGADRVLIYSRFDDSSKDFPVDTKFAQIGILKNPKNFVSDSLYTADRFSALYSLKINLSTGSPIPIVGERIEQIFSNGSKALGYVASYDRVTTVLKYFKDRSLYYQPGGPDYDQTDYVGISSSADATVNFSTSGGQVRGVESGFISSIDSTFNNSVVTVGNKTINLDVSFISGIAKPEINKTSGDILYIDNRPLVERNSRQKEDIKIILEF
jgi:hypothetical protein